MELTRGQKIAIGSVASSAAGDIVRSMNEDIDGRREGIKSALERVMHATLEIAGEMFEEKENK